MDVRSRTTSMQPFGCSVHAGPFYRSNEPYKYPFLLMIVCYNLPSFLMIQISNVQNVKISRGCPFRRYLCNMLALTAMKDNFQGQMSPEAFILHVFLMILCYISPSLLKIWISNVQTVDIFFTFFMSFSIHSYSLMGGQFKGQTSSLAHTSL